MEDYNKLFTESLTAFKQSLDVKYYHWFDVWFGCIRFENYNPDTHTLTLRLPSNYVYEFLESSGRKQLLMVLKTVFKEETAQVVLQYRIVEPKPKPDFSQLVAQLKRQGFNTGGPMPHVCIPDAEQCMRQSLKELVGENYRWVPAYDKVAAWLTENQGKWLHCFGFSGTGKSKLCREVLPLLLGFENVVVCSAIEMTEHNGKMARIDELLKAKVIVIDGLGKESAEVSHFGRHRRPFYELCDAAEREGKLLILTTNCLATKAMPDDWPYKSQFPVTYGEYYGEDVLSRLRAHAVNVAFTEIFR